MKKEIAWPIKIIALSFVILIVITNVWLHHFLLGGDLPAWAKDLMFICSAMIVLSGIAQAILWIKKKL